MHDHLCWVVFHCTSRSTRATVLCSAQTRCQRFHGKARDTQSQPLTPLAPRLPRVSHPNPLNRRAFYDTSSRRSTRSGPYATCFHGAKSAEVGPGGRVCSARGKYYRQPHVERGSHKARRRVADAAMIAPPIGFMYIFTQRGHAAVRSGKAVI